MSLVLILGNIVSNFKSFKILFVDFSNGWGNFTNAVVNQALDAIFQMVNLDWYLFILLAIFVMNFVLFACLPHSAFVPNDLWEESAIFNTFHAQNLVKDARTKDTQWQSSVK